MNFIPGNAQHIGARQQQQDSFGFSNLADAAFRKHGGILAVVADGMGGMAHGEAAGKCAVKAFLEAYAAKTETEPIPDALLRSILAANAAVYQMALELKAAEEMGTTLVAAVIHNERLHWISSGDSGIFLFRKGEFTTLNVPHIFGVELDDQVEKGTIPREVAEAHPEREALTSFLGMEKLAQIDRSLRPLALREKDIVLLASDGLFKTLPFAEMLPLMDSDAQRMCEALVEKTIAAERPHQDNVTVLAIAAEKERPSVATVPMRGAAGIPGKKSSRLGMLIALVGLLAVAGYLYYMFAYTPVRPGQAPAVPAAAPEQPGRTGEPFEPGGTPKVERQPEDNPPTPEPTPRQESEPPQGPLQDGEKR